MLATITLATTEGSFGTWLGSTVGMVAADALAILVGQQLAKRVSGKVMCISSGSANLGSSTSGSVGSGSVGMGSGLVGMASVSVAMASGSGRCCPFGRSTMSSASRQSA